MWRATCWRGTSTGVSYLRPVRKKGVPVVLMDHVDELACTVQHAPEAITVQVLGPADGGDWALLI